MLELAREYVAAGAQVIETNTFGANYTKLSAIGLGHKVAEINLAGAGIAREAAGGNVLVAGSVGPLVAIKGEERELAVPEMEEFFRIQCPALAEGGVDFLLLETFTSLQQLKLAVKVARETGLAGKRLAGLSGRGPER